MLFCKDPSIKDRVREERAAAMRQAEVKATEQIREQHGGEMDKTGEKDSSGPPSHLEYSA